MANCARKECRRWRPGLLVRAAGLGLRMDGAWFCSEACVMASAARRLRQVQARSATADAAPPLRLGTLLVHQGAITPAQLAEALRSQARSGLRLGAELRRLGYADGETVLRALAAQAGTSYLSSVDPAAAHPAPGGLCAEEVQALGVVPLRTADRERALIVACAAPLPRAALGALRVLTGWTPVPYLVTDEDHRALMAAYGAHATVQRPPVRASRIDSVREAAREIAAAATTEGSITVTEAYVSPYTWVRVAGQRSINALFVEFEEEDPWLAATTRH